MKYKANEMDLLEGMSLPDYQPYLCFQFRIHGSIDQHRLYHALCACIEKIPQLACRYDPKRNCWYPIPDLKEAMLLKQVDIIDFSSWDLTSSPQLQIQLKRKEKETMMAIGISHILTDGNGAMQLLSLLCAAYRGESLASIANVRNLISIPLKQRRQKEKRMPASLMTYEIAKEGKKQKVCVNGIKIADIKKAAAHQKATVNDMLLCAYLQTLHVISGQTTITVPCPVNLRPFLRTCPKQTIANFTGDYRVTVNNLDQKMWTQILKEVHEQMLEERRCNHDIPLIKLLHYCYRLLPLCLGRKVASCGYHSPAISFTNLGVLDHEQIDFDDCKILQAFMVTRPRHYPSIQISASTYREECTFTCHVVGSEADIAQAEQLLLVFYRYLKEYAATYSSIT